MANTKPAWAFRKTSDELATFSGGTPYLERDESWPETEVGVPLSFLFQVDLSTVPDLGLDLPDSGYLQFFHTPDDLYGLNFNNVTTHNCLVRVLEDTDDVVTDTEVSRSPEYSPLSEKGRVFYSGELVEMAPRPGTYDYKGGDPDAASEFEFDFYLGGHPMFTQEDFRYGMNPMPILLLGSDSGENLMWGDMGSAGFWLPGDSAPDDYSGAFLYWDCF